MLFLTLDTFSNTGGIQRVCRTLAHALTETLKELLTDDLPLHMLSLYDSAPDNRYITDPQFKGFKGNKMHFVFKAIYKGLSNQTIIISHINLLPIAICIKIFNKRSKIIMLAHGTEVWRDIVFWKRNFIKKQTLVWAVSNFTKQILHKKHGIDLNNITVLHNCLDPYFKTPVVFNKPQHLLKKHRLTKHQPVLLSIARLSGYDKNKGYDTIINLLPSLVRQFSNLQYIICGKATPQEKNRLNNLILKNDLQKHVLLTGFIDEQEIVQYYTLADLFILPSSKEGFGLVFIEAAACGCNIISGNADGSCDAMLNGRLGKMVNPNSITEISTAISQSLLKEQNHQTALSTQKICLEHFSYQQYKSHVKNLLLNLWMIRTGQ